MQKLVQLSPSNKKKEIIDTVHKQIKCCYELKNVYDIQVGFVVSLYKSLVTVITVDFENCNIQLLLLHINKFFGENFKREKSKMKSLFSIIVLLGVLIGIGIVSSNFLRRGKYKLVLFFFQKYNQ